MNLKLWLCCALKHVTWLLAIITISRQSSHSDVDNLKTSFLSPTVWQQPKDRKILPLAKIKCTDQEGKHYSLRNFADRPMLVTYFYTRCQNSYKCSATIAHLAELQKVLQKHDLYENVRLLGITFEPQFDTPTRIERYGLERSLVFDKNTRLILIEPKGHSELLEALKVPANFNSGWVNSHGIELNLIDKSGRLVRKYHSILWDHKEVLADLERLLLEAR